MAAVLLVVLGFTLLGIDSGSGLGNNISTSILDDGSKTLLTCVLNSNDTAITGHRWMKGNRMLHVDWEHDRTTEYEVDPTDRPGQYFCTFFSSPVDRTASLNVNEAPKVEAVDASKVGIEGERVVLACHSQSFPQVTEWSWYKINNGGSYVLNNKSQHKFVVSTEVRTELHIQRLILKTDPGEYACYGANAVGKDRAIIKLQVRSRLIALWPFLGALIEVTVLVTLILLYERCEKPGEAPGVEDAGSAPAKISGEGTNDKDKGDAN